MAAVGLMQMLAAMKPAGSGVTLTGRFVGEKALTFTASTTATATVAAVDLGLPASATKQILIFVGAELGLCTNITINGVRAGWVYVGGQFFTAAAAVYAGSGPFNVVVTMAPSITESGGILVYEIDGAAPICESIIGSATSRSNANIRQQSGSFVIAAGYHPTDTTTFTWTGVTENFDADVGNYRLSSAVDFTLAASRASRTITANPPTNGFLISLGVIPVGSIGQIRGGYHGIYFVTGSGTTFTITDPQFTNLNDLGNLELIIAVTVPINGTITGVTFNGVAMTSRGSSINTGPNPDLVLHYFSISLTAGSASGNLVVTASATTTGIVAQISFWKLFGVTGYGTLVSNTGTATGATTSAAMNNGGAILFTAMNAQGNIDITGGPEQVIDTGGPAIETACANVINDAAATYNFTTTQPSLAYSQAALPIVP